MITETQLAARVDRLMQTNAGRAEVAAMRAQTKASARAKATTALLAGAKTRRARKHAARQTSGKACPGCTEGPGPLKVRSATGTAHWHHECYERARHRTGGGSAPVRPAGLRTSRAG